MKYQTNYSEHFPATKNIPIRQQKALKIIKLLSDFLHRERFEGLMCLDLGCSIGIVSHELSKRGGTVVGVDIDLEAMKRSPAYPDQVNFLVSDGGRLPFPDKSFDIIVCSQVYEHVPCLSLLISEITRLIKNEGVCFFSGPNRWAIIEEHYHLPFLSWLPKSLANFYVKFFKKASAYYENPKSARYLRKALNSFNIHDLTLQLLQNPERYEMGGNVRRLRFLFRIMPKWSFQVISVIIPNFNWILTK